MKKNKFKNLCSQILGNRIKELGVREVLILKSLNPLSYILFPETAASKFSVLKFKIICVLTVAILMFNLQIAFAAHQWVYSGENIEVYVEDTTIDVSEDGKEFSITVIDKIVGQKTAHLSRFNFYQQDDNWFYNITGKGIVVPVSHTNSSGYILDFAKKYLPEEKSSEEEITED